MSITNYPDADFTPNIPDSIANTGKQSYNPTGSFRFWAQKVLPTVYDDSLSYYEILTKVVNYLNAVIQNVDSLNESVDNTNSAFDDLQAYVNTSKYSLIMAYNKLQSYVNTYFDSLDVQEEINAKLDGMASDGSLSELIAPFIPSLVSDWLSDNITPTSPAIDASLSVSGAGADAEVTGELIANLDDRIGDIERYFQKSNLIAGFLDAAVNSSAVTNVSSKSLTVYFPVENGKTYTIDKKYVTQLCRIAYTTQTPTFLASVTNYENLGGGSPTYRTFTATQDGYCCAYIYNSDTDTNVTKDTLRNAIVVYEGEYNVFFADSANLINVQNFNDAVADIEDIQSHIAKENLITGSVNGFFTPSNMTITSNSAYLILFFPVEKGETYTIDKKQVTPYFRTAFSESVPSVGVTLTDYISGVPTEETYATITAPYTGYCAVCVSASTAQHTTILTNAVAYKGEYNPNITQSTVTLKNINGEGQKVFYCGPTRVLSTLKEGIEEATKYMDSILYVDPGTYNLITEFGNEYFEGLTSSDTLSGLRLKNRVHVIFSPNSKVVSHYTGNNKYAMSLYSPFNAGKYGFTLENLNIECSNCRYAIHDERNGGTEEYKSHYINCKMKIDNSENSVWSPRHCIGGGLGSNAEVIVENSIFESDDATNRAGVYYHISNDSSNADYRAIVVVKDCYFITGTASFDDVTNTPESISDNSEYVVTNCNFPIKYAGCNDEGVYNGLVKSYNLRAWNNYIRNE